MSWQNIPFYMFFIIRPDGSSAYCKFHEQYPLSIEIDKLLGLISLVSAVNNLQTGIVHPEVVAQRKDQIDLVHKNNIKSFSTTTFQIRMLDNVSGYRFALMAGNSMKSSHLDDKLDQVYKCFVNYVIKSPFFNDLCLEMCPHLDDPIGFATCDVVTTFIFYNKIKLYFTVDNPSQLFQTLTEQYFKLTSQHLELNINGLIINPQIRICSIIQSEKEKALFQRLLNDRKNDSFVLKKSQQSQFNALIYKIITENAKINQSLQQKVEQNQSLEQKIKPNKSQEQKTNKNSQLNQKGIPKYANYDSKTNQKNKAQIKSSSIVSKVNSAPEKSSNLQQQKIKHESFANKSPTSINSAYKHVANNMGKLFKEKPQQEKNIKSGINQQKIGKNLSQCQIETAKNHQKFIYWIDDEPLNNKTFIYQHLTPQNIFVHQIQSTQEMITILEQKQQKYQSSNQLSNQTQENLSLSNKGILALKERPDTLFISDMTRKQGGNINTQAGIDLYLYIYHKLGLTNKGVFYVGDIKQTQNKILKNKLETKHIEIVNKQPSLILAIYTALGISGSKKQPHL